MNPMVIGIGLGIPFDNTHVGGGVPGATFRILAENMDKLLTEASDHLRKEQNS